MSFESEGYEIIERFLSDRDRRRLLASLARHALAPLRGGIRRIDQIIPEVATLAHSPLLKKTAKNYLPANPHLVRAIYFDKNPDRNWFVTWHQDRTIAVSNRFEMEGWGPWSRKAGIWHVQPPLAVLESMVTIRVHLDAATSLNGCLKVAAGSHRLGLIPSNCAHEQTKQHKTVYCEAPAGGALVMRPYVLHSSERSVTAASRKLLHFEYSCFHLPDGVEWAA